LYTWWLPIKRSPTVQTNSIRLRRLKKPPTKPDKKPNPRYKVPISLWFVEKNQREIKKPK
jgi:hypothetical protein